MERLNGSISNLVHGSRHAAMQIFCSVSAFLSLPVRIRMLPENNLVRLFCDKMLRGGQRRVKISVVIDPKTFAVGLFKPCDPVPQYISEALGNYLNIVGGRCKYFFRILKKGISYVANNYPVVVQKQSSYAVVLSDDVPLLCRIECFIRWTACDERCAPACAVCVPRFLWMRQYEIIPWEVHYIPNVDMSYLCKVTPTDIIGAFPVECLRMPCF